MQSPSEICSLHTTILNISGEGGRRWAGGGGGREEDISSISQTKKQPIFEEEKHRIVKHVNVLIFDYYTSK